jgi:hypothetical protein
MAVHSEMKKRFDTLVPPVTWVEGTPNATIAPANNTLSAQQLLDLIQVAAATGHQVSLAAGTLTVSPRP